MGESKEAGRGRLIRWTRRHKGIAATLLALLGLGPPAGLGVFLADHGSMPVLGMLLIAAASGWWGSIYVELVHEVVLAIARQALEDRKVKS